MLNPIACLADLPNSYSIMRLQDRGLLSQDAPVTFWTKLFLTFFGEHYEQSTH